MVEQAISRLVVASGPDHLLQPIDGAEDDKATVTRLECLFLLACTHSDGFTRTPELHQHLRCNSVTAKKIIQSASDAGLITSVSSRIYAGPKLYQWSARLNCQPSTLVDLCRSILLELVQETGETVGFLHYDAASCHAQFQDVIQGWRPIHYKLQTGVDVPLHAGAAGKAVLAHLEPRMIESMDLKAFTEATITSLDALKANLEAIRCCGWATGEGERVPGAFGLAVPFFVDGKVKGSISATIPQYRKDDCDLPALLESMKGAANRIGMLLSLKIGGLPPKPVKR